MTIEEAIVRCLKVVFSPNANPMDVEFQERLQLADWLTELLMLREKCRQPSVEINLFDEEETYPDCTVQVLRNSVTGAISVGWWKNE